MKTSYRVMKTSEHNGKDPSITFRIACDCQSPECDIWADFEISDFLPTLTFYKTVGFYPHRFNFLETWKNKFVAIYKILFNNTLETEGCIYFGGEEHIQSFIDALKEGKEFIRSKGK
ncbi:MAG: hypothetical protein WC055_01105 [Melioribacteraceae bacterium]